MNRNQTCDFLFDFWLSDFVAVVWDSMKDSEIYAVKDLAGKLWRSESDVRRIIVFLLKFGFVSYVSQREGLFQRVSGLPPEGALRLLKSVLSESV